MNKHKILIFVLLCLLLPVLLQGQVDTAWVRIYNGPGNGSDRAYSLAADGQGNVYVTGYNTGSGADKNYATIKYNSAGGPQWLQTYNGPGNGDDEATSLAIDGQGNVYVTGYSPGSGTYEDYATIKYNSAGGPQWVQRYNGPGNGIDEAYAIAVDGSANVYVTGVSEGSNTYDDYATIKYNSAGVSQWLQTYNGPENSWDEAHAIAVDGAGNVYVTGGSGGVTASSDYRTIKYNSTGVQQWVQTYNGPGNGYDGAYSLAVDGQGNVYVTGSSIGSGTSLDYATIKYNSTGVQQWVQRYNGPGNFYDEAYAIAVDGSGNVYVTGCSASQNSSPYNFDYATIKYVQTGAIEENHSPLSAQNYTLELFPNPAKTYFNIRFSQSADRSQIKIFDISGKEIRCLRLDVASAPSTLRVTLDGIKNGVYFVQVGNEMVKEKLVVTKKYE